MKRNLLIVILFWPLFTLNLNLCTRLPAKKSAFSSSLSLSLCRLYLSHPTKRFIEHNNRIFQTKVDGLLSEITLNIAIVCMLCGVWFDYLFAVLLLLMQICDLLFFNTECKTIVRWKHATKLTLYTHKNVVRTFCVLLAKLKTYTFTRTQTKQTLPNEMEYFSWKLKLQRVYYWTSCTSKKSSNSTKIIIFYPCVSKY